MPGFEVVIVGGGIIGWACAWALTQRGIRVGIIDPGPVAGAASAASAGMLAAQTEAHDERDPMVLGLCVEARELTLRTAVALTEATGIDFGLLESGIVQLALDESDEPALRAAVVRQRELGFHAEWIDAARVRAEWPDVAPTHGAAFAPDDRALDPVAFTEGLRRAAIRLGASLIREHAIALVTGAGRATGVETEAGLRTADAVVLAAGVWSTALRGLPRALAVSPMRGQMIALPWPDGLKPTILYGRGGYVLQRHSELLVGATMEAVGFDHATTAAGRSQLQAVVRAVVPTLATAPITRHWAGLRPMTPDGLPLIGPDPVLPGLWYATGHGRNGILLAVLTGEIIADLVQSGETTIDADAFRPDRLN